MFSLFFGRAGRVHWSTARFSLQSLWKQSVVAQSCTKQHGIIPMMLASGSSSGLGLDYSPDSKVHGANMGPTWVLSAPDGPHVGPITIAICAVWNIKGVFGKD